MAGFFGRTHELEVVRAALARAPAEQRPSAVVVDGEPGVGKSRLIEEASRNADRVAVSAYEPEMNLPFSLGHDLIRALARSSQAAEQILDPMLAPEPGGPRPDWTSVFEAAHRAAGVRDSLLITIDDFQWSDERSTALVHYLVRGAQADGDPLALVVGGRRSIAVSALVTALERLLGDRLTRVTLGPLDHHSTVELARAVNPALDPRAAAAVADRSGGSPFWCQLLAEARDVEADVARIVADRLSAAGTDAAVLFETIALLGRQAPVEDLIAIRGWPADRLTAARAELMATGLVVEEGGALRIVHDLVRAAVDAQLPDEQRRDIHARVASWLEGAAGENVTLLLRASEAKNRAGLDHLPLTLRILRSPMRRLVGLDGLQSIVALIDSVPAGTPHERELQGELASLAAELGQQGLAMERWARIADRLDTPRDRARAWLGASDAAQQLERTDDARAHLERARSAGSDDPVARAPPEGSGKRDERRSRTRSRPGHVDPPDGGARATLPERIPTHPCPRLRGRDAGERTGGHPAPGRGDDTGCSRRRHRGIPADKPQAWLGSHAPGSPRRGRGAARCGVAGGAPRVSVGDRSRHRDVAHSNALHARPPDRGSGGRRRM